MKLPLMLIVSDTVSSSFAVFSFFALLVFLKMAHLLAISNIK